jgi:hypothetical protein
MDPLDTVILEVWRNFQGFVGEKAIVAPSIPVLWFGDYEAYKCSPRKVLTVSINPSYKEFVADNDRASVSLRFPRAARLVGKKWLSSTDILDYRMALNAYFSEDPYMRFFGQWDKYLKPVDASYYTGTRKNTAIHVDLFAPVATTKTWGNTDSQVKCDLEQSFQGLFCNLIQVLSPDLVFSSQDKIYDRLSIVSNNVTTALQLGKHSGGMIVLHGKSKGRSLWGHVAVTDIEVLIKKGII